jgi:hypothetical protein
VLAPRRALVALSLVVLVGAPATTHAQIFLASQPHPEFAIGPLFVAVNVRPNLDPVGVTLSWSLTAPPGLRSSDIKQDLYLLWPAEIAEATAPGAAEPAMVKYIEARGFAVTSSGRLVMGTRDRLQMGTGAPATPLPQTATFVTYVRHTGPAAQLGVGTYIKIPWTPKLGDPLAVSVLAMSFRGLVTPKPATWFEESFWGRRWILSAGFGDVGALVLPLYPLYFEHRDRVVRLAREYSLVIANFADSEHLRIEEIAPPAATRRPSRVRTGTDNVTMPLAPTEGITPQLLKVQFSYFSGAIAWRPILVSLALLALGNLAGFIMLSRDVSGFLRARLHLRRRDEPEFARNAGGVLPPTLAERIVPGATNESEVRALLGHPDEEGHRRSPALRRTLIYRGMRRLPQTRLAVGRLTTVSAWQEEHHEIEVELDGDRVSAVHSRVRRQRA